MGIMGRTRKELLRLPASPALPGSARPTLEGTCPPPSRSLPACRRAWLWHGCCEKTKAGLIRWWEEAGVTRALGKLSCLFTAPQLLPGSERECGRPTRAVYSCWGPSHRAGCCKLGWSRAGTQGGGEGGALAEVLGQGCQAFLSPRASLSQPRPWEVALENSPKRGYR